MLKTSTSITPLRWKTKISELMLSLLLGVSLSSTVISDSTNVIPTADVRHLNETIRKDFSSIRFSYGDITPKVIARNAIVARMKEYGLDVTLHSFTTTSEKLIDRKDDIIHGLNIIGVMPGENWGTEEDKILLIGAHYDTVEHSPGVDDNGSGVAAILEVARALTSSNCKLDYSLFFLAFDAEELGLKGSYYFVNDILVPNILIQSKSKFKGAYILDTVMNYDDEENSQKTPPGAEQMLPELYEKLSKGGFKGNFHAVMSRLDEDHNISVPLVKAWEKLSSPEYGVEHVQIDIAKLQGINIRDFLRSDHTNFWYHNSETGQSHLSAVFITDTANFRGKMQKCYHHPCDDVSFLTPKNLQFLKKLTDALIVSSLELTEGSCKGSGRSVHQMASKIMLALLCLSCLRRFLSNSVDM